ncbi:MAG: type II secretion system protein [Chlamydiia bacterium]
MAKRSRRALTLIEIMVVLFIIGLALSVLIPWMKGSLDEGKAFKTRQRARQMEQMLTMAAAQEGLSLEAIAQEPKKYLATTGMVKDATKFIVGGWGEELRAEVDGDRLRVISPNYRKYMKGKYGDGWTEAKEDE